ncbi:MAG: ribonuclease [Bacteroidetes bacterium]|nr:MAG: ribonuclease [Bacteroidota bacterium]
MKKKNYLLLLIPLLILALVFLLRFAYTSYKFLKQPVLPLTHAVPANTVAILRSGSIADFIAKSRASGLGELLQASGSGISFNDLASMVDSLGLHDVMLQDIFENSGFILSVLPNPDGKPGLLISVEVSGKSIRTLQKSILSALNDNNITSAKADKEYPDIYVLGNGQKSIWYYLHNGIFTLGFNPEMVSESRQAINSAHPFTNQRSFAKLNAASGKKVDAVLFVRNDLLFDFSTRNSLKNEMDIGSFFKSWSALDLTIAKDRVMLSGFTLADNQNWMIKQNPAQLDVINAFPADFAVAVSMSIDNIDNFLLEQEVKDTLKLIYKSSDLRGSGNDIFRVNDHLKPWIGTNVSLLKDVRHGNRKDLLLLIESKNADSARIALQSFINFSAVPLPKMRANGITDRLFGEMFATTDSLYCMFTSNYVALSPSAELIDLYSRRLMESGTELKSRIPTDMLNEKSNLLIYFSAADIINAARSESEKNWTRYLQACEHIILQYSGGDSMIYTQGSIVFNPLLTLAQASTPQDAESQKQESEVQEPPVSDEKKEEIPAKEEPKEEIVTSGFKTNLKPVVLSGQKGGQKVVAIADANSVTLLDDEGKKLWQFKCTGKPNGDIFEVIPAETGKRNYVIITDSHFHIIGVDGKEAKNSPHRLPGGNAGNASLFDYDRNRDYRLVYPGKDGKIYNITLAGRELPDWSRPELQLPVQQPLFFRTTGKDYLLFPYSDGKLRIADRRGRTRISVPDGFRKSQKAGIFENKTNSKGVFMTASKDGQLVYISASGVISYSSFENFGNDPWFVYTDFDGDNSMDFLFAGNGRIGIYSRMKKELAGFSKKGADFGSPVIYNSASGVQWIAIRELGSGDIVLFQGKNKKPVVLKLKSQSDPVIFNPGGRKPEMMVTMKNGKPVYTEIK